MAGDEKQAHTQTKCAWRNARSGRTWELGRERGDQEGRPLDLAPHKANSRARELEHKYRPPLCLKPTFQISRCQDLVQKETQMR
ncbi:unnamed protein product [Sphagnum troendelagicum]|uniref:Uncharacterized protein n=1 Tax=Sphagnum jensenii TaxID=128206 RepID=A0ABP0WY39_9BRYO